MCLQFRHEADEIYCTYFRILRAMRKDVEENAGLQKQRNTVELLKDSVKKQVRLETEREGTSWVLSVHSS